ncbi:MAG: hypothetical protein O0V67_06930 [Methanocorpusculum sp.]|nr:hypothetical protein [Methanocorpusculum sp.]
MGYWTENYQLYLASAAEQGWGDLVNGNFETIDAKLKEHADTLTSHTQSHDSVDGKMKMSADLIVPSPYKIAGNLQGNVIGNLNGDVTGNLSGNVTGNLNGNVTGSINGWSFSSPNYVSPQGEPNRSISEGTRTIWNNRPISGYLPIKGYAPNMGWHLTITASFYNKTGLLLSTVSNNTSSVNNISIPSGCYKIVLTCTGNSTGYYGAGNPTATLLPGVTTFIPFA